MKVLFLTNIPSPYRVEFFNEMGKQCELTVWYEYKREPAENRDVSWENDDAHNYIAKYSFRFKDFKKFDFIIICGISTKMEMKALCYLKFFKIPYYLEIDGGFPKTKEFFFIKSVKKFLISGAVGYFSTAEMADQYLVKYGADKEKIYRYHFSSVTKEQILSNDISENIKQRLRLKLKLENIDTILYVGRFIGFKRMDLLLEAASGLECQLVLVGGEINQEIQQLIDKYDLKRVKVIPFVKYEKLKEYYCAADVFVFPSENDIWGLVVNESMANALPVISSTGCIAGLELIEENLNGFLFESKNASELRKKIMTFFQLTFEKRFKMKQNALKTARLYTIEQMVEDHMQILMGETNV